MKLFSVSDTKGSPFKKSPLALPVGEGWDGIITMMSCDTDNCYDEDMMTMLVVYGCDAIFTIVLLREHQVYKNLRESSADHVMTIDTSCIVMMMKITSMIMMTMTMTMTMMMTMNMMPGWLWMIDDSSGSVEKIKRL